MKIYHKDLNIRRDGVSPRFGETDKIGKYERCPERRWILKYFALERIQADNPMMAYPESLSDVAPSVSTPASAKVRQVEVGGQG